MITVESEPFLLEKECNLLTVSSLCEKIQLTNVS